MASRNFYAYVFALFFVAATLVGCGGGSKPITISGTLPATGTVGTAYSGSLTATGGDGNLSWSVSGLPAGVTASIAPSAGTATVTVSGTPTAAGTSNVVANVRDNKGRMASYSVTVVISAPSLALTSTLAATGTVGSNYAGTITVAGGTAPYTWVVSGLPAGVTAAPSTTATISISGMPTAAATSNITASVTDNAGLTGTFNLSVVVSAAAGLTITGTLPATGTTGTAYTGTLTATGGSGSYTWSVTNLPDGTKVSDPSQPSITVSGKPTTAKTYSFVAKVTDNNGGANTSYNVKIVISGGAVTTACMINPTARGNESAFNLPYAFILSGSNGDAGPTIYGGSVTPDGTGKITAGSMDAVIDGVASQFTVSAAGSSYSLGSDGRGCLSLAVSTVSAVAKKTPLRIAVPKAVKAIKGTRFAKIQRNASQQDAAPTSFVFSISLATPYEVGRIQEFDYDTQGLVAAGQMHQQTSSAFSLASLGTNFVIGAAGFEDAGELGFVRAAMAAAFTNANGVVTSPATDLNIGGVASGMLNGGTGALGTVDPTTGRGEGQYTVEGGVSFDFAYYVINGGDFYVVSNDSDDSDTVFLTGRALAASTSTPALNGYYMAAISGLDGDAAANVATIGTFQAPSAGSIANATLYTNDAGTYSGPMKYASGTYTLDATTGRMAISGVTSNPPVGYLTATTADDGISAFIVGTDPDATSGFLFLQTGGTPNFNNNNALSGGYAFGSADDAAGANGSQVGQYNFTSDDFTSTIDVVAPFVSGSDALQPDQTATNTYNVNSDGSGTLDGANIAFVTNGTVTFGIDTTSSQPLLYIMVSQTPAE